MNTQASSAAEAPISRRDNYLAKDILLTEAVNPAYVRNTIRLACIGVVLFVIWSIFAQVDVVTRAPGQIAPLASVQEIQHLDGGKIAAIAVKDGQHVRKGALLMAIDDQEARADLDTTRARYWALFARNQRLRAVATGGAADFSAIPAEFRKFADEEQKILAIMRGSHADELNVVRNQMGQVSSELSVMQELAAIRGDLASERLVSRTSYLDTARVLAQLQGQRATLGSQMAAVSSGRSRDAADEMSRTETELAQLGEQLAKLEARVTRSRITAPMDGVVQGLAYHTIGGVVAPGARVMNVVPLDQKIEAEVRVAATDVGHVRVGQPVRVKVGSYDFLRYGTLNGTVSMVAANSTVTDRGESYFVTRIAVAPPSAPDGSKGLADKQLLAGMTVETDIVTDRQSVLHYLLAPIMRAVEGAFSER